MLSTWLSRFGLRMTTTWVVRADGGALLEAFRVAGLVAIVGGSASGQVAEDLSGADRDDIARLVRSAGLSGVFTGMLNDFVNGIGFGSQVLTPGPTAGVAPADRVVLVGTVTGEYEYMAEGPIPGHPHVRRVDWRGVLPRQSLEQDVRLDDRRTVYQVEDLRKSAD